ncbi:hypothetical protein L204_104755 [Cryptococcus depauperatus]|nr:hypothetical protein L204_05255 [Cryptococcus depauperatus CBS 7855]
MDSEDQPEDSTPDAWGYTSKSSDGTKQGQSASGKPHPSPPPSSSAKDTNLQPSRGRRSRKPSTFAEWRRSRVKAENKHLEFLKKTRDHWVSRLGTEEGQMAKDFVTSYESEIEATLNTIKDSSLAFQQAQSLSQSNREKTVIYQEYEKETYEPIFGGG